MNRTTFIEYDISFMTYSRNGEKFNSDCNKIWLMNIGNTTAIINNQLKLIPQANVVISPTVIVNPVYSSWESEGNMFEIDRTQYQVTFEEIPQIVATGLPIVKALCVIRKIYKYPDRALEYMRSLMNDERR